MTPPAESNLWRLLEALGRRRTFLLAFVGIMTALTVLVALLLPVWYQASALLLPPKEVSAPIDQLARFSEAISVTGGLNLPVMVTSSDVYARMLQSRAVNDRIIEQFNLDRRYRTEHRTETYEELDAHTKFRVTEQGLLEILVEDRRPDTAALMANAYVDEIVALSRDITSARARENVTFIELRLLEARLRLDSARSALEQFQTANKTIDFDQQTRLAIEQATALKVDLARAELDVELGRQFLGADHPDFKERVQRRDIIRTQIEQIEQGGRDTSYLSLPLGAIPNLRGHFELLHGQLRVAEATYTYLLEQSVQARLAEQQHATVISVLDRARIPDEKSRPKRGLIVIAAFAVSLMLGTLGCLFAQYLDDLAESRPEDYRRATAALSAWFGWLPGVRFRPPQSRQ